MDQPETTRRLMLGAAIAGGAAFGAVSAASAAESSPLVVIAEIVAKPEHADELRGILTPFASVARQEKGCLSYALYEDRSQAGHFYTYETWSGDAALDAHLASPAMKAAGPRLAPLLASAPSINRMTALNVL